MKDRHNSDRAFQKFIEYNWIVIKVTSYNVVKKGCS